MLKCREGDWIYRKRAIGTKRVNFFSHVRSTEDALAFRPPTPSTCVWCLPLLLLIFLVRVDGRQNEFGIRVNQHPASVDSNVSVWLECEFPLHNENLLSVIWYKGDELVYAQTLSRNTGPPEYEDIVDEDESKMELSLEGMSEWSKSILKLHVTYCEAGDYNCRVTDTDTRQAEIMHTLKFKGPTVELDATVNGTAISGSSSNISVGQDITLTGRYAAIAHANEDDFRVEPSDGFVLEQGHTTHIPADGDCIYAGETSGGTLRFTQPGQYDVKYVIDINGNKYEKVFPLSVIADDDEGEKEEDDDAGEKEEYDDAGEKEEEKERDDDGGDGGAIAGGIIVSFILILILAGFLCYRNNPRCQEATRRVFTRSEDRELPPEETAMSPEA